VTNDNDFEPQLFLPHDVEPEYRGLGLAQGACLRNVRQIFDRRIRAESKLVLGEVINYPGRWSSYPPHHHEQPEIYHYRFNQPQGYGHGEVGDDVFKVRAFDTLLIPGMNDHAQVAAPGYAMYYLWIVRHLEGKPYEGFEFAPEHEWVLDAKSGVWEPSDVPYSSREADGTQAIGGRRPWTRGTDDNGSSPHGPRSGEQSARKASSTSKAKSTGKPKSRSVASKRPTKKAKASKGKRNGTGRSGAGKAK